MNNEDFENKTKIIRETFDDDREILYPTHSNLLDANHDIPIIGDIFTTSEGDLINLGVQLTDFDEVELTKKVELAETLYEKYHKRVSIYVLCPKNIDILMKECIIKSESEFDIKVARIEEDVCAITLDDIKTKLKNNRTLDKDDLYALSMLPIICRKDERNYYRMEYFKIINNLNY